MEESRTTGLTIPSTYRPAKVRTICEPRFSATGVRLIGGCRGPQEGWKWARHVFENRTKFGDPDGTWSEIIATLCPDCEALWTYDNKQMADQPCNLLERHYFMRNFGYADGSRVTNGVATT